MGKSAKDIIAELQAHAEYLTYSDLPKHDEIVKSLHNTIDFILDVSERPEGVHPGFDSDNIKEFVKDIVGTGNYLFTKYLRKSDKLRRFKTIRWLANCAIEKLENGK